MERNCRVLDKLLLQLLPLETFTSHTEKFRTAESGRGLSHLNKCGSLLTWKKQTVSDRIIRSSRRQSASYFFRTTTSVAYSVFVFFRLPRTNEFRVFRSVSFGEDYLCSERWPSARFRRRHSPVPDTGIVGRLRLLSKVRTRLQPEYCD